MKTAWENNGIFTPHPMTDQPSIIVFDTRNVGWRDFSRWETFPDSKGFRRSAALVGLKIHLIASRCSFNFQTGEVLYKQ
ncbi:hypothetical protein HYY75_01730 [bacterium]|nr:hypothetical protein [bacterium]